MSSYDKNTNNVELGQMDKTCICRKGKVRLRRALVFWHVQQQKEGEKDQVVLSALRVEADWTYVFGEWDLRLTDYTTTLEAHAFFAGCDLAGFACNAETEELVAVFKNRGVEFGYELRRRVDTKLLFYHYYPGLIIPCYGNPFIGALRCYGVSPLPNEDDVKGRLMADAAMLKVMLIRHKKSRTIGVIDQYLFPGQRTNWGYQLGECSFADGL